MDVRNTKIMCLHTWTCHQPYMDKLQIWEEVKSSAELSTWGKAQRADGAVWSKLRPWFCLLRLV